MTTSVADVKTETVISDNDLKSLSSIEKEDLAEALTREMLNASEKLDFERAAQLRDEIERIKGNKKKSKEYFRYSRRNR